MAFTIATESLLYLNTGCPKTKPVFMLSRVYIGQFSCFLTLYWGSLGQEIDLSHMPNMCPTCVKDVLEISLFWFLVAIAT